MQPAPERCGGGGVTQRFATQANAFSVALAQHKHVGGDEAGDWPAMGEELQAELAVASCLQAIRRLELEQTAC